MPIRERRTGNRTYIDLAQFISSKTGIMLLCSGLHYDSVITEYFPPFDTPWPDLHEHNTFMNDTNDHLYTECGMESWSTTP